MNWPIPCSIIVAAITACIPPSSSTPGAAPVTAAHEDPAGAEYAEPGITGTCEGACRKWADCMNKDYDACLGYCNPDNYEGNASVERRSCEEIAESASSVGNGGGGGRGDGSACRTNGTNDCPAMSVCCRGNPSLGRPGQCLSAAVCGMPTR